MMRFLDKLISLLLVLLLTISCEVSERLPKELVERNFVILGSLIPGDTLMVDVKVSSSVYEVVHDTVTLTDQVRANVSYSVNGGNLIDMKLVSKRHKQGPRTICKNYFVSDYILKIGDKVQIVVRDSSDNISTARVESVVLSPPDYSIESLHSSYNYDQIELSLGGVSQRKAYNKTASTDYKFTLRDNPNEDNYYMLCVNGQSSLIILGFNQSYKLLLPSINQNLIVEPKSSVFVDMNISHSFGGIKEGYTNVFSDETFNGSDFEFVVNVKTGEQLRSVKVDPETDFGRKLAYNYNDFVEDGYLYYNNYTFGASALTHLFLVEIDRATYLYHKSFMYNMSFKESEGIFGSPNYLHSNVSDGYGVLSSMSPGKLTSFTKTGEIVDTTFYLNVQDNVMINIRDLDLDGKWYVDEFSELDYFLDYHPSDTLMEDNQCTMFRKMHKIDDWCISFQNITEAMFGNPFYMVETEKIYQENPSENGLRVQILSHDMMSVHIGPTIGYVSLQWDKMNPMSNYLKLVDEQGRSKIIGFLYY